jgi:hypothetical protein
MGRTNSAPAYGLTDAVCSCLSLVGARGSFVSRTLPRCVYSPANTLYYMTATNKNDDSGRRGLSMTDEVDDDIKAITTLISVLKPLDPQARIHILDFVFKRLGIAVPAEATPSSQLVTPPPHVVLPPPASPPVMQPSVVDIRTFAKEKMPKTVNEKVAVLAYYLAHLAPVSERRDYLVADDIQSYFIQADFQLPTSPERITLSNAKNAGYLNASERGQYTLNAVGHNLVAHKLPSSDQPNEGKRKRAVNRKPAKKKTRAKSKR